MEELNEDITEEKTDEAEEYSNVTFYYAQLNDENICTSVGSQPVKVDSENMIELDSFDTNVLGCRYNDGVWEKVETEVKEYVNEQELIRAELLLNQMTIIEKQEEHDEVLAEILLSSIERGGENA